jgi:hypothetical protein
MKKACSEWHAFPFCTPCSVRIWSALPFLDLFHIFHFQLPPRGLEEIDASGIQGNDLRQSDPASAAQSGAAGPGTGSHQVAADPELQRVVEAWPHLPDEIKARVLALVEGPRQGGP